MRSEVRLPTVGLQSGSAGGTGGATIRGAAIFKTGDGGVTWAQLPFTANNASFFLVNDLVVSPNDSRRLYTGTGTGVWRSLDGGASWTQVLPQPVFGGCTDLATRVDPNPALKDGATTSTRARSRFGKSLVVAQVALSLLLLVGAGLLLQSFARLQQTELGFDAANLLTLKVDPPWSRYKYVHQTAPFYRRVVEEIERIPGVTAVAWNDSLPLAGQDVRAGANKLTFEIEGQPRNEQERNPFVNAQIVNHAYFTALGIPLRQGRAFNALSLPKSWRFM